MAFNEVLVCNMALSRINIGQTIEALTDSNAAAGQCDLWYVPCRDAVLEDHAWSFATAFATLALIEEADAQDWADRWGYLYRLPTDCVRALGLELGVRGADPAPAAFQVGHDASGLVVYTDQPDAILRYTKRFTEAQFFSASFASALAWRIASEIAAPLAKKDGLREWAIRNYNAEILRAAANAANQGRTGDAPDAEHIRARA